MADEWERRESGGKEASGRFSPAWVSSLLFVLLPLSLTPFNLTFGTDLLPTTILFLENEKVRVCSLPVRSVET